MFTITNKQLDILRNHSLHEFVKSLIMKLQDDDIHINDEGILRQIINDAKGAGITSKRLIYEYSKLALSQQLYALHVKPEWLKNILYSKANPISKIDAIKSYIDEQIQLENGL